MLDKPVPDPRALSLPDPGLPDPGLPDPDQPEDSCKAWDSKKNSIGSHTVEVTLEPDATPPGPIYFPNSSTLPSEEPGIGVDIKLNLPVDNFRVAWGEASEKPKRYELWRKSEGSSIWQMDYSGPDLYKDFTNLLTGTHQFRARACNSGCSSFTEIKSTTVIGTPFEVKAFYFNDGKIVVSWLPVEGADHYIVQERKDGGSWTEVYRGTENRTTLTSRGYGKFVFQVAAVKDGTTGVFKATWITVDRSPVSTPPFVATVPSPTDPSVLASDRVGTLPGGFHVSESGTATYTIPLQVGPSSGGNTPALSVTYSSSVSNGPLGVGWDISGLSAISACRKTLEEDGVNGSAFDRFCLDGQRLKLVSGQYGSFGSEYRTSIDSFVRVRLVSSPTGNGQGFEVYRKDGSVSYYGMNVDAQQEKVWHLNTHEDSVGNRIEYTYLKDAVLGEHLIETVDYSANGQDATLNRIQFHYDTNRNDKIYGYRFGQKIAATRRLTAITSSAHSVVLRRYNFSYQKSSTRRLLLEEVEECVKSNCRKPTVFTYTKSDGNGLVNGLANPNIFHSGFESGKYGDVNGDGRTDFVFISYDDSTRKRYIRIALGTDQGSLAIQPGQMYIHSGDGRGWHLLDYNNDGKDDLLHIPINDSGNWWEVNYSKGTAFSSTNISTSIRYQKGQLGQMHDFNADGLPDYLKFTSAEGVYSGGGRPTIIIHELQRSSNGTLSFKSSETTHTLSLPKVSVPGGVSPANFLSTIQVKLRNSDMVADLNDDGIADLTAIVKMNWVCRVAPSDCNNQSHVTTNYFVVLMSEGNNSYKVVFHRSLNGEAVQVYDADHRIADLNGDGLLDLLFRSSADSNWELHYFTGEGFVSKGTLPGYVSNKIQLYDWDMDGLVDILYPTVRDQVNNEYQYLYVKLNSSDGFENPIDTGILFGADTNDHSHYIMDLTGDGRPEIIENCANRDEKENHCDDMLNRSGFFSGSGSTDKYVRVLKSKHADKPVDVLESVENGFGVRTEIQYARLNDNSANVYTRKKGSFKLNYGRGSPIFDLYSPIYVVKKVISDAPAANDNNNTVEAHYHYAGARTQSGGRGFLGFESVTTYDPQNKVKATTRYRQDYPYVGMPSQTAKVIEPNANNIKTPASCSESSLKLISCSVNTLKSVEPVFGKTVMPYISQAQDKSYSLNGDYLGKVVTTTNYTAANDVKYGNVSSVVVKNYDASNALVQSKTTSNKYNNVDSSRRWHLARLTESSVTTQRYGSLAAPQIKRTVHFGYDDQTGLLTDEWVAKGSAQEMHTHYEHDRFGNRIKSIVTDALGESRSSRTAYDNYGRFPISQTNTLDQKVAQYLEIDAYGQPRQVLDIGEVATIYAYSEFGTRFFERHETGSYSTTLSALCADSGGCPTIAGVPAHFKVTTTGIEQAESVTYHDRLGREIRKQTQDFHGNPVYVDIQYDAQSRVKRISEPYSSSSSPRWTTYSYDILGRTTKVDAPSGQCDSTITYNGLTETIQNCAQQTKVTQKSVLGELAQVTDNIGGKLRYSYYADGKLKQVSTLNSGGAETSATLVEYDYLGRKTRMVDSDKGSWTYGYTGFGELAWQKDAKGQGTAISYDALGRMVTRADYTGFNSSSQTGTLQNFSRWFFDEYPGCNPIKFKGKLVAVAQAPVNIKAGCNINVEDVSYLKLLHYDKYGRLGETVTVLGVLDGEGDFYEKVAYDQYGRISRNFDASNQQVDKKRDYLHGVETVYNPFGYKVGARDVTAPADSGYYYRVKRMNLRGQVEEVLLGNGLTTTYAYDPQNYRLTSILTGINPGLGQVQNLHYDWNAVGNLLSKSDFSGDGSYRKDLQERFEYDDLNRLRYTYLYQAGSQAATQEVRYDDAGNITYKTGVGSYEYNGPRPHAVTKAGNTSYQYDKNGNMSGDSSSRTLDYTVFDKPSLITKGNHDTRFYYGPDRNRFKRVDDNGKGTVTTLQIGSVEKVIERSVSGAHTKSFYRRNIAGVAIERVELDSTDETSDSSTQYLHKDLQGSLDVITDSKGQVAKDAAGNKLVYSFDAWGKRRNPLNWGHIGSGPSNTVKALNVGAFYHLSNNRGYTGHEMLDEVGLIHMNGRVYDPVLGRFLQADPHIQAPRDGQNFNRYSYVLNSPLIHTDPSGYFFKKLKRFAKRLNRWRRKSHRYSYAYKKYKVTSNSTLKIHFGIHRTLSKNVKFVRNVDNYIATHRWAQVGVQAVATYYGGAYGASAASMHIAYTQGASIEDIRAAGQKSFVSAYMFQNINNYYGNTWDAGRVGWTATAGGVTSKLNGGKFIDGFKSAGVMASARYGYRKLSMMPNADGQPYNQNGEPHLWQEGKPDVGKQLTQGELDTIAAGGSIPLSSDQSAFMRGVAKGPYMDAFAEFHDGLHGLPYVPVDQVSLVLTMPPSYVVTLLAAMQPYTHSYIWGEESK
ncbi:FG-GAP-like repeat-containing protein [Microbulbifer sp. DLAB2-AF]|uniref:FG-GAP-like repeat-containing protein n=1 Tax=Microbulbifer sp. DLAB2-AF TaxID=3243395 RepID=UPI00403A52A1